MNNESKALDACRILVAAYDQAIHDGTAVDLDAINDAWQAAQDALEESESMAPAGSAAVSKREKPVCAHCRSDNVKVDAWACWNAETQAWALDSYFDQEYCDVCEGETRVDWVEVPA